MIQVLVDDRERPSGVIQQLRSHTDVRLSVKRLNEGDYQIDQRLLVERKTIRDFVGSLFDGRLFRQGCRLSSSSLRPLLIIEGRRSPAFSERTRHALQSALICMTVVLGIPVLRSNDTQETARLMLSAAKQLAKRVRGAVQRPGYRPRGKRKRQLFILQGLPGIGSNRAEALLDFFGCIEAVMEADEEELIEVPGIGDELAEAIRRVVC